MKRWHVLVLFLLAYTFTAKGYIQVIDTGTSLDTAEAIVSRGELSVPPGERRTFAGVNGRAYSKYGVGLPLIFVPEVAAAHVLAPVTHRPEADLAGFFVSFVNVASGLLLLWTFGRTLMRFGVRERDTTLLTLALGLGTLCWYYAGSDFSEELQAALLFLSFDYVTRRTPRGFLIGGIVFAALVVLKTVYVVYFPFFALYVLKASDKELRERIRATVFFAAPFAAALALQLVLNALRFGNPLETGYGKDAHPGSAALLLVSVPALLVSLRKGLFVFCPVVILGLLGWPAFLRERKLEGILIAALLVVDLFFMGSFDYWDGGWCWGPRYLVPMIPFWLFPAAFWLKETNGQRRFLIAAALTGASIVAQVPGIFVKEQEIHEVQFNVLDAQERLHMRSDPSDAWMLFMHKVRGIDETYAASDFGAPTDRPIVLTDHRTFVGLNVWTEMLARQLNKRAIRWLGVAALLAALLLLARVAAGLWSTRTASDVPS